MNIQLNSETKTIVITDANLSEFFEFIYELGLDLSEWKISSKVEVVNIEKYIPNIPYTRPTYISPIQYDNVQIWCTT